MPSYYSVDYCGTARNKRLHTSTEYLVDAVLCRGSRGSAIRTRVGGQEGRTHMDGPPRHGTESVPSRLRLWSLLAAEPAVHEDHTQCLSQIPHRFWPWAPTDTRFWGTRGAPGLPVSVQGVCVPAVLYAL